MWFSQEVRSELARLPAPRECCRKAELAAFLRGGGRLELSGREASLEVEVQDPAVARRLLGLLKATFPVSAEVLVRRNNRLRKNNAYLVRVPPSADVQGILLALEATDEAFIPSVGVPPFVWRRSCCRRAFLRASFLTCGSLTDPGKGYHLEWAVADCALAQGLQRLLASFQVKAGLSQRKRGFVVYVKEAEDISTTLRLLGADAAVLRFENARVLREVRNQVNRQVNCETANVDKAVTAALRQIEEIKWFDAYLGLERLPRRLREVARARLAHPEASLAELGQFLRPRLGKSAVNHRMRRLLALVRAHQDRAREGR